MSWIEYLFEKRPPLETAFSACSTPQAVCRVVSHWIKASDRDETERRPLEEVWRRGWGDCDDLARLVEFGCERIGIVAQVLWFYPMFKKHEKGHAITCGFNYAWYSSNADYATRPPESSINETIARLQGWPAAWHVPAPANNGRTFDAPTKEPR